MSEITKYQKSRKRTINRSDIKNAPYNPRRIDKNAKKRLGESIKNHGYVGGIVYNKQTGNIVGGHQRIDALDTLEERIDYLLEIDEIDVDEVEEMEINIALNARQLQGDWDTDLLGEVLNSLAEKGRNVNRTGMTAFDIAELCGDAVLQGQWKEQRDVEAPIIDELAELKMLARDLSPDLPEDDTGKEPSLAVPTPKTKWDEKTPEEKRVELSDRRKEYAEEISQEEDADFMISFVFPDNATRDAFLSKFGLPRSKRYFDTYEIQEAFKVKLIE